VSGSAKRFEQPISWLEPSGNQQLFNELSGTCLRVSPSGRRLAFASKGDISVYDLDRDGTTRITFDTNGNNRHPVWTPDGKYLAYAGSGGIWWTRSDGSAQPTRILEGNPAPTPWSLATDGPKRLRLAYHAQASQTDTQRDIWVLPIDITDADRPAPGKPEVFLATPAIEVSPSFSPDGHWMAYTSTEFGGNEVFVRRYRPGAPAAGGTWQITTGAGALFPVWSRDGKQLLFRSASGFIMAVDYTISGESFTAGKPHEWSKAPIYMTGVFQDFDLFPDGKRAAIVALPDETKGGIIRPHANFLLNFFDELKRRLP
jgi:dipeptidyl aminopeptidase/acylaminoacyl peptidase